jgi:hypothetical protein
VRLQSSREMAFGFTSEKSANPKCPRKMFAVTR